MVTLIPKEKKKISPLSWFILIQTASSHSPLNTPSSLALYNSRDQGQPSHPITSSPLVLALGYPLSSRERVLKALHSSGMKARRHKCLLACLDEALQPSHGHLLRPWDHTVAGPERPLFGQTFPPASLSRVLLFTLVVVGECLQVYGCLMVCVLLKLKGIMPSSKYLLRLVCMLCRHDAVCTCLNITSLRT